MTGLRRCTPDAVMAPLDSQASGTRPRTAAASLDAPGPITARRRKRAVAAAAEPVVAEAASASAAPLRARKPPARPRSPDEPAPVGKPQKRGRIVPPSAAPVPALSPEPPREMEAPAPRRASRALFVLDMHTFDEMRVGEIPIIPYSHDRNVLLLAHVVARHSIELYVCCGPDGALERKFRRVARVYPRWEFTAEFVADPELVDFDLIVCAGIEALMMRSTFPEAKLVGILPALHMFEAPGLFRPKFVYNFIQSLRHQIDFIITQNERMREAIVFLCHWLARWDPSPRVLTARLGLSRDMESVVDTESPAYLAKRIEGRRKLGLSDQHILIVNAGGAWNWTDCDTFLEAVCLHARAGGRVRVYFSGITQPDNHEINRVRDRILELFAQYPECFSSDLGDGKPIYIERDWSRGGRDIHTFLKAGDFGLSVNKTGFEGWQSHRVRIVDYIGAGLPLLAAGDDLLTREFCAPPLRAVSGSIQSYLGILQWLETEAADRLAAMKRQAVTEHRAALDGDVIYGAAIDHIMATPRRSTAEIAGMERNFLELIEQQSEDRLREEVQQKLRRVLEL